ncbi:rhythmically expressed gene 2 protein-like [Anopheles aquasalis]|uniref:rhythmically expressed gene 2 protein-like n=1 Tax=Anopheles aquasalis TaxID=42839 RepID=UPI00215AD745|nr:rhythmically expressed gene 2 protein-like [Anopheles aquasalis]
MNHLRKNLSRFRLITFDVTDTLLEYATPPECYYAQVINGVLKPNLGLTIDEQAIAHSFGRCFRVLKTQHPNFGCSSPPAHLDERVPNVENWRWWWRTLVERVILDAAKRSANELPSGLLLRIADQLIEDYTRDAAGVCWKKRPGVDDFLQQLRQTTEPSNQPLLLGIVSNFDPRLPTILRRHELLKPGDGGGGGGGVDFVLTSYGIGREKPDPTIFHAALRRANGLAEGVIHPHEALHIGNLCVEDYQGARGAGWHALLVNVPGKARASDKCRHIQGHHIFAGIPELQSCLSLAPTFRW